METVNVINEALDSGFERISEEIPKEILPPEPRGVQEIVNQEPTSPSTPSTPSFVEGLTDIPVRIRALKSYCMMLCMLFCMTLCMT